MLSLCASHCSHGVSRLMRACGHAAFVIYDGDQKRVLAARDRQGSQDMHWGVTDDGRFMFGSQDIDLTECNPTATPFPAGPISFQVLVGGHS